MAAGQHFLHSCNPGHDRLRLTAVLRVGQLHNRRLGSGTARKTEGRRTDVDPKLSCDLPSKRGRGREERRGEEGEEAGSVDLIELRSCVLAPFSVPLLFATLDDLMPTDGRGRRRQTCDASERTSERASLLLRAPTAARSWPGKPPQPPLVKPTARRAKPRYHCRALRSPANGAFCARGVPLIFSKGCANFPNIFYKDLTTQDGDIAHPRSTCSNTNNTQRRVKERAARSMTTTSKDGGTEFAASAASRARKRGGRDQSACIGSEGRKERRYRGKGDATRVGLV